jgi:hypothetical protein
MRTLAASMLLLLPALTILLPESAGALGPGIEEWTATWSGVPMTRSDDFEDGFVPGDPNDTGDTEPATGQGCRAPEPGDESGGVLTFRRPGRGPVCITPFGGGTQAAHLNFAALGDVTARAIWEFSVPQTDEAYLLQLQNIDAAMGGPDIQRANLIVNRRSGDLVVFVNDENIDDVELANLGPASGFEGQSGSIELELSLSVSGSDMLPHGRYRLCLPSCGDESTDPFIDLADVSGNDGALDADDAHMAVIVAVFEPPRTPALGRTGLIMLGAALAIAGLTAVAVRGRRVARSRTASS